MVAALPASAHPLGNFTTNLHLGVRIGREAVDVTLIIDMAEIPAFRELRAAGLESGERWETYASESCTRHSGEIELSSGESRLALILVDSKLTLPPGQAGLTTLRLTCRYQGAMQAVFNLAVENRVYEDRLGWREMTVTADGLKVQTDLPSTSPSALLTAYPAGEMLDVRSARLVITAQDAIDPVVNPSGGLPPVMAADRLGGALTAGGSWAGPLAALAALVLGAGHALAPGHGKTLIAAYLVARRGTMRHATGLGLSVAVAHTLGVAGLGLITVAVSASVPAERLYPWLSASSALIITLVGVGLLQGALRRRIHHHDHDHPSTESRHREPGWRSLAVLGLAGGLVPSASAVVLLLGAINLGRPAFGLVLVGCFGLGMSVALVGAGTLAVGAIRIGHRLFDSHALAHWWERRVPLVAGALVTLIGLALLWSAQPWTLAT
jgi:ABC-type nickel/cobalt efflux system permease component RcnA